MSDSERPDTTGLKALLDHFGVTQPGDGAQVLLNGTPVNRIVPGEPVANYEISRGTEAWDSSPADSESAVDYALKGNNDLARVSDDHGLPPEMRVELVVTCPDGRSYCYSEGIECREWTRGTSLAPELVEAITAVSQAAIQRLSDGDG